MQAACIKPMSNPTPPQEPPPVCKPTKWFIWRAVAMLVMFSVFAILFLTDGLWGYRKKNLQYYMHANFEQAGKEFTRMENQGGVTESDWKRFAGSKKCEFPSDAEAILPKGTDLKMPWPEILVNGYETMKKEGGQLGAVKLWEEYSSSRKWSAEQPEHDLNAGKIREQFIAAGIAGLLIAITLFFLIRTLRRRIRADEEALYTQDGRRIPYSDMVRIDKRKWDTKGLALIDYKDGDTEKTAKIDGMVYGQFKEEDGAPAEKLFSYVMNRFKGEVIEYATDDENEDEDAAEENGASA